MASKTRKRAESGTETRLEGFIRANDIRPIELARVTAVSRQHLHRLRKGKEDPTRHVMVRLAMACTMIIRRRVRIEELFDLNDPGMPREPRKRSRKRGSKR